MNLLIDMGNSRIKWQLRMAGRLCESGVESYENGFAWLSRGKSSVVRVLVSCVAADERRQSLVEALSERGMPEPEFAAASPEAAGVRCGYRDYRSLGVDRWLALLAVKNRGLGPWVIVDSGTALTVDLLDQGGEHLGGYIAPGVSLMRCALAGQSAALGAALSREAFRLGEEAGEDTRGAIDHAIFVMGQSLIERAMARFEGASLVLTGGDAGVWLEAFPAAQVVDGLVFDGLERCFRG